jgi:hypothetical protein
MVPMRKMVVTLAVLAAIAAFSTAGFSGKGGGKGGGVQSSSTPPIQLNQDPASLSLGSTVTFSYSADSRIKYPEITVTCEQNGTRVWGDTQYAASNSFLLGGDFWSPWKMTGGAASCTASLFFFSNSDAVMTLGSTTFDAKG